MNRSYKAFRRSLSVFILLLICIQVSAHKEIGWWGFGEGNIDCRIHSSTRAVEQKFSILYYLSKKLVREKLPKEEYFNIYIQQDCDFPDSSFCTLGYGQTGFSWEAKKSGLILIIRNRDFDIRSTLNIISSACENIEFIRHNQVIKFFKTRLIDSDLILSISPEIIDRYASANRPDVEILLNERVYRKKVSLYTIQDCESGIDFYFQNNQFHLFSIDYDRELKINTTRDSGEVLLKTKNIFEIVESGKLEHLIFINDSTFYSINTVWDAAIRGPFTIPAYLKNRRTIKKAIHQDFPFESYSFLINSKDSLQKILFVPDSNLVIPNYDKVEKVIVTDFLQKKKDQKGKSKIDDRIILLGVLLISVCINAVLLLRRRSPNN